MAMRSTMRIWLLATLAVISGAACETTAGGNGSSSGEAGAGGVGGSAGNGAGGSAGNDVGGSAGGSPGCGSGSVGAPPVGFDRNQLPSPPTTHQGVITNVSDTCMAITTDTGVEMFAWKGPSLMSKFAQGDAVTVRFFDVGTVGLGGYASWGIVGSTKATAAALSDNIWTMASTQTGGTHTIDTPPDFPALRAINKGCTTSDMSDFCDYSSLEASLGSMMITVDAPNTGTLGEWSVTHLEGHYSTVGEYIFSTTMTLLGPATSAP